MFAAPVIRADDQAKPPAEQVKALIAEYDQAHDEYIKIVTAAKTRAKMNTRRREEKRRPAISSIS